MENRHRQKGWREEETLEAAARRLWRDWDERIAKKKAEEALQSSSKIADQPAVSLADADDRADGESDQGLSTLDRRPFPTAGVEGGSSGKVAGEVGCAGPVEPNEVTMRSPAPDADSNRYMLTTGLEGPQSRAVRRGKG